MHGYVTDGSGENIFVVRDGHPLHAADLGGCLDGITRDTVITLARDAGYEVREDNLVRTDLYNADECFFTGTAAELTPIREVDDRDGGRGASRSRHEGAPVRVLRGHQGREPRTRGLADLRRRRSLTRFGRAPSRLNSRGSSGSG